MRPAGDVQVVLELVVVLVVAIDADVASAAGERSLDRQRRIDGDRRLVVAVADVLEARLVQQFGAVGLRIAELQNLLGVGAVVALRSQLELPTAGMGGSGALQLVAQGERLHLAPLQVEARREIERACGARYRLGERHGVVRGIQHDCVDDGVVYGVLAEDARKDRGVFRDRTVQVAVKFIRMVRRLGMDKRVGRVPGGIVALHPVLAVQLVRARLGEDLDAPEA